MSLSREQIFAAIEASGLKSVKSCCNVKLKLCEGDIWTGNLEGFAHHIQKLSNKPDPVLCKFYGVETYSELLRVMMNQIEKLQARLPKQADSFQFPPNGGRQG